MASAQHLQNPNLAGVDASEMAVVFQCLIMNSLDFIIENKVHVTVCHENTTL